MTEKTNWNQLQTLFEKAVNLSETEREQFIQQACASNDTLRKELEALLQADKLDSHNFGDATKKTKNADSDLQLCGTTVGPWRILKRIGVGGMGSVFLAERADGSFEQQVALKIVKQGMDTESVLQRFRRERQILAQLNHANIASLLDGGVTDDGRPYFVMEYIDGVSITEYCDSNRLGLKQRLALFQDACNAIHYAHQSLIVHRDLKPSNIIVTSDGVLKLLDFGIAKLLDASDAGQLTRAGQQIHTPAYAAPEQWLDDAITTATDVYALGVILYELLSGRKPYELKRSTKEFRDLVLTGNPIKPSAIVTKKPAFDNDQSHITVEELSALRGSRVDRLQKSLQGDLDTICLMALRNEPSQRYPSADQLAGDIQRYLKGMPVVARPDAYLYRVNKFVRRHRTALAAAFFVVAGFVILSVIYTIRISQERDLALDEQRKANEVVNFVTALFRVSDPAESGGRDISVRQILDEGALRINSELAERPTIQSTMKRVLGEVYYSLGAHEKSKELITSALQQQQQIYGANSLDVATSQLALGMLHHDAGELDAAEVLLSKSYATRKAIHGELHAEVMEALANQASLKESQGEYAKAELLHAKVLRMAKLLYPQAHANLAEAMTSLAGLYRIMDRYDDAESLLRDALKMQGTIYSGDHPEMANTQRQLAGLLRDTYQFAESESLYKQVIASRTRMLGPDHLELAHTWNSYSQMLSDKGDFDQAIAANRTFIEITERAYHGPHPSLGAAYNNLAVMMKEQTNYTEALKYYQLSIDMQDAVNMAPEHPHRTFPTTGIAEVLIRLRRFVEAESLLRVAMSIREASYPDKHDLVQELNSSLGAALIGLEEYAEAEQLLLQAYIFFEQSAGAANGNTTTAAKRLAFIYKVTGDPENAELYSRRAEIE